jgi:hypothetical protein
MAAFYFVRYYTEPGQPPRGSRSFLSLKAVRSYARRVLYAHPNWVAQIVRHHVGGGQVVVEEVR